MYDSDEDEDDFFGTYTEGKWIWDNISGGLLFEAEQIQLFDKTESVFRKNVDVIDQLRFQRRFQRKIKPGEPSIVTLQDVKDVAFFTAPNDLVSLKLIHLLHVPAMERFLRALIFYFHYFTQICDSMSERMEEGLYKIRLPLSELIENEFRENIADLRTLIAKEYCSLLTGNGDFRNFHHMGRNKNQRSLSDGDIIIHEALFQFMLQIIWLALHRRNLNVIEYELHRLFRSSAFSIADHNPDKRVSMTRQEKKICHGTHIVKCRRLKQTSPFFREMHCAKDVRLVALGELGCKEKDRRLSEMEAAISAPEEKLEYLGVSLGIIGLPRAIFDAMLIDVRMAKAEDTRKSKAGLSLASLSLRLASSKKIVSFVKLYEDIVLHPRRSTLPMPDIFPTIPPTYPPRSCSRKQRDRWIEKFCH